MTNTVSRHKQLALVIDLNVCVGCHACVTSCKEWNASGSAGPLVDENPYGARELDEKRQVMTKCTLCVDRIYDEKLAPEDRKPACVMACPTNARLFGDIHDPQSEAATAIRERGGYKLMPEWETLPANHYLPRVITETVVTEAKRAG